MAVLVEAHEGPPGAAPRGPVTGPGSSPTQAPGAGATDPASPAPATGWAPPARAVGVFMLRPAGDEPAGPAEAAEISAAAARVIAGHLGARGRARVDGLWVVADLFDNHPRRVRALLHTAAVELGRSGLVMPDGSTRHAHVGIGWASLAAHSRPSAVAQAQMHAAESLEHNDLSVRPVLRGDGAAGPARRGSPLLTKWQIVLSALVAVGAPLALMIAAFNAGLDLSGPVYLVVVLAIVVTVTLQFVEGGLALRAPTPPTVGRSVPRPPASAIIAAYLPNEQATIVETVRCFLALQYAGELQVILAYNTSRPLPVEQELAAIAAADPRLVLLAVQPSTSKAQNVNAALAVATGTFVGIFDADHHPMPDAFERAWRWLSAGHDVVQGHCVVRNGEDSAVARMVAVEFEQIYGVGHIGRQRLHGFGVFGGSGGFWRTEVLRSIRMRGDRLTEDIDSSIRALRAGYRVVNDRDLISRELAPTTWSALWKQRIRWAQGWHEVSRYNWRAMLTDPGLTGRQRFGLGQLLLWREWYMWVTPLIWSLLLFAVWRDGALSISSPVLILLTVAVLACGPIQLLFAHRVADPQIRARRWWWWSYLLVNLVLYQEYKNLIGRVAQIKHLMGERHWTVTPRTAGARAASPAPIGARAALIGEGA